MIRQLVEIKTSWLTKEDSNEDRLIVYFTVFNAFLGDEETFILYRDRIFLAKHVMSINHPRVFSIEFEYGKSRTMDMAEDTARALWEILQEDFDFICLEVA